MALEPTIQSPGLTESEESHCYLLIPGDARNPEWYVLTYHDNGEGWVPAQDVDERERHEFTICRRVEDAMTWPQAEAERIHAIARLQFPKIQIVSCLP